MTSSRGGRAFCGSGVADGDLSEAGSKPHSDLGRGCGSITVVAKPYRFDHGVAALHTVFWRFGPDACAQFAPPTRCTSAASANNADAADSPARRHGDLFIDDDAASS